MPALLSVVQRPTESHEDTPKITVRDVYDLDNLDLDAFPGISLSAACDQRFLAARADRLTDWVRRGGKLLVHGHIRAQILDQLPKHRKLEFHSTRDLWLTAGDAHPIWDGIDRRDLLFNTGVPGNHSFDELTRIGVAGFYCRSYFVDLPEHTKVITTIGQSQLPADLSYPLGEGEVILHSGNDLLGFARLGTTAADLGDRVVRYLTSTNTNTQETTR